MRAPLLAALLAAGALAATAQPHEAPPPHLDAAAAGPFDEDDASGSGGLLGDGGGYEDDPRSAAELHSAALLAALHDDHETALGMLVGVVYKDSASPLYWNNLGVVLLRLEEWETAQECFARALELDPHYKDASLNLADVQDFLAAGGATAHADRGAAVEQHPPPPPAHHHQPPPVHHQQAPPAPHHQQHHVASPPHAQAPVPGSPHYPPHHGQRSAPHHAHPAPPHPPVADIEDEGATSPLFPPSGAPLDFDEAADDATDIVVVFLDGPTEGAAASEETRFTAEAFDPAITPLVRNDVESPLFAAGAPGERHGGFDPSTAAPDDRENLELRLSQLLEPLGYQAQPPPLSAAPLGELSFPRVVHSLSLLPVLERSRYWDAADQERLFATGSAVPYVLPLAPPAVRGRPAAAWADMARHAALAAAAGVLGAQRAPPLAPPPPLLGEDFLTLGRRFPTMAAQVWEENGVPREAGEAGREGIPLPGPRPGAGLVPLPQALAALLGTVDSDADNGTGEGHVLVAGRIVTAFPIAEEWEALLETLAPLREGEGTGRGRKRQQQQRASGPPLPRRPGWLDALPHPVGAGAGAAAACLAPGATTSPLLEAAGEASGAALRWLHVLSPNASLYARVSPGGGGLPVWQTQVSGSSVWQVCPPSSVMVYYYQTQGEKGSSGSSGVYGPDDNAAANAPAPTPAMCRNAADEPSLAAKRAASDAEAASGGGCGARRMAWRAGASLDLFAPPYAANPGLNATHCFVGELQEGDTLLVPPGWWYQPLNARLDAPAVVVGGVGVAPGQADQAAAFVEATWGATCASRGGRKDELLAWLDAASRLPAAAAAADAATERAGPSRGQRPSHSPVALEPLDLFATAEAVAATPTPHPAWRAGLDDADCAAAAAACAAWLNAAGGRDLGTLSPLYSPRDEAGTSSGEADEGDEEGVALCSGVRNGRELVGRLGGAVPPAPARGKQKPLQNATATSAPAFLPLKGLLGDVPDFYLAFADGDKEEEDVIFPADAAAALPPLAACRPEVRALVTCPASAV